MYVYVCHCMLFPDPRKVARHIALVGWLGLLVVTRCNRITPYLDILYIGGYSFRYSTRPQKEADEKEKYNEIIILLCENDDVD